jgi:hypothetical protein
MENCWNIVRFYNKFFKNNHRVRVAAQQALERHLDISARSKQYCEIEVRKLVCLFVNSGL